MWSEVIPIAVCSVFSLVCSQSTRHLARFSKIGSETPQGATVNSMQRRNMMEYLLMNRFLHYFFSLYCVSFTFHSFSFFLPFGRLCARRSQCPQEYKWIDVWERTFRFFHLRVSISACLWSARCMCVRTCVCVFRSAQIIINCSKTKYTFFPFLLELANELMKWNAPGIWTEKNWKQVSAH